MFWVEARSNRSVRPNWRHPASEERAWTGPHQDAHHAAKHNAAEGARSGKTIVRLRLSLTTTSTPAPFGAGGSAGIQLGLAVAAVNHATRTLMGRRHHGSATWLAPSAAFRLDLAVR